MESNSISANPAATFTRQSRWILASREELNGGAIAWSEICASECIARLLLRKGFHSAAEVENFLRPRLNSLSDPFLLPQMETAVSRVLDALDRHQRIVLFGDYDVDGVTSLALLDEILRAYGGAPELFGPLFEHAKEDGLVAGVGAVVTACQRVGIRSQVQRLSRPHRGDRRGRRRRRRPLVEAGANGDSSALPVSDVPPEASAVNGSEPSFVPEPEMISPPKPEE